jgi:hypothetical protein
MKRWNYNMKPDIKKNGSLILRSRFRLSLATYNIFKYRTLHNEKMLLIRCNDHLRLVISISNYNYIYKYHFNYVTYSYFYVSFSWQFEIFLFKLI